MRDIRAEAYRTVSVSASIRRTRFRSTTELDTYHVTRYTLVVIVSFRHKGLEKFFLRGIRGGIRPEHARRLRLVLARLHAARVPRDMALPGLRLHALKGAWKGRWAVEVSGNWRLVFRFDGTDVVEVDYVDYH